MKESDYVKNIRDKIVIYYSHQGKKLRISTGIDWKKGDLHDNRKKWKSLEDKMRALITQYVVNDPKSKNPPIEWLQKEMERPEEKVNNTLMEWYENFYEEKKYTEQRKHGTLKGYENLRTALYDYQTHQNITLQFEDVTPEFLNSFQEFISKAHDGKGLNNNNTIQKRMVCFKSFMKYCDETKGAFKFDKEVKNYKGYVTGYTIDSVVLSSDELKFIYSLPLKGMEEKVRDLFIFMCMCGLRFSDVHDLSKEQIKNGVIEKEAIKTRDKLRIPLNKIATEILIKYNYMLPQYENQVVNRVIKDILKEHDTFKVKERVKTEYYGNEKTIEYVEKWTLVSSHSCRRSFITNCVLAGIPINEIMKMTGHKKLETLQLYVEKYKKVGTVYVDRLDFMKSPVKNVKKK